MDNYSNSIVSEDIFYDERGNKYTNVPLFMGFTKYIGFGQGGFNGNVPTPTGPCPFRGKSADEKFAMCGVRPGMSSAEAKATGNIIQYKMRNQSSGLWFNKNVINDLEAIQNEVEQLGWFTFRIGNCFRDHASAGGKSRHQIGCAVDINPNSNPSGGGNPWFNVHLCTHFNGISHTAKVTNNFNDGDRAPWTKNPKWTGVAGWSEGSFVYKKATSIWDVNHPVVKIFANHGWDWGGEYGDVMHFSLDGS